jgi:chemotaxis protein MotD
MLTIQLHPAELGQVQVRLRLQGNALSMQLRASSRETARLLENDRQALSELLKGSGYDAETLAVRGDAAEPFRPVTGGPDLTGAQDSSFRSETGTALSGRQRDEAPREGHPGQRQRDDDIQKGLSRNAESTGESVLRSDLYV